MRYTGTAVSAGVVIGKVYLYERFVSDVSKCPMGTPAEEAAHYLAARDAAQGELETLCQHFTELGDNEKASIFSAHLEILSDETMDEEIQAGISGGESSGPWVIRSVYEQYASMFEQLADPIIRERAVDLPPAALLGRPAGAEPLRAAGAGDHHHPRPGALRHGDTGPEQCAWHRHGDRRQHLSQRHHRPQL